MKKLKPLMFVGTASDVGKSVITTGFCRLFWQEGFHPAPFKAQNMSLNSYVSPEGLEIGRAQAVQAEAAGIPCHSDMNPVLLKPTGDKSSQLVLHGVAQGNRSARAYFLDDKKELFKEVSQAYERLAQQYNPIVIEGAGSISELNLKKRDITNMRIALHAQADTYLISDIERGGVFGSVYGTLALLPPEERKLIKGLIINKFRGDASLFEEGKKILEEICQVPVVGVLPYFQDIFIEEEDSLGLDKHKPNDAKEGVKVAVLKLSRLSNFTDFDVLAQDPRVQLGYTREPSEILNADIVILPGSKSTIADLQELKEEGLDQAIVEAHQQEKTLIGICGGYQMMGERVDDPEGVEGNQRSIAGLGILPVQTILRSYKTTQRRIFYHKDYPGTCQGYEIHMGETTCTSPQTTNTPLNRLEDSTPEGYQLNAKTWGTYLHGILDNPIVVQDLLQTYTNETYALPDYQSFKDKQYDKLAQHLKKHLDLEYMYQHLMNH